MRLLDLVGGKLVASSNPNVAFIQLQATDASTGKPLGEPLVVPVAPTDRDPIRATLKNVPLGKAILLTAVASDADGRELYDYQRHTFLKIGDIPSIDLDLTRLDDFVSGVVTLQPMVAITPRFVDFLRARMAQELADRGVKIENEGLLFPQSTGGRWRITLEGNTVLADQDGRFRIPKPVSGSQAFVTHSTDDTFVCPFDPTGLSRGQRANTDLLVGLGFKFSCGMSGPVDEFCAPVPDVDPSRFRQDTHRPADLDSQTLNRLLVVIVGRGHPYTINDCGMRVPLPTEIRELERGTYPKPLSLTTHGGTTTAEEVGCHARCDDGREDSIVRYNATGNAYLDYLGSVCEKYVLVGCCPNENVASDSEYLAYYYNLIERVELGDSGGQSRRTLLIKPPLPRDIFTCQDNHRGRACQQCLVGDVSLDFRASGKAGLIKPHDSTPTILVQRGEQVEFVLHNNGCYGITNLVRPIRIPQLEGTLLRTFREVPSTKSRVPGGGQRFTSTDTGLIGPVPNLGQLEDFNVPAQEVVVNENFVSQTIQGQTNVVALKHFFESGIKNSPRACAQYRYFPDMALRYDVPSSARPGQSDTFVFDVDGCSVAQPEWEPQPQSQPQSEWEPQPQPESEWEPQPQSQPESEREPQPQSQPKSEYQSGRAHQQSSYHHRVALSPTNRYGYHREQRQ